VQSQIWEQRTEQPTAPVQNLVFDFEAIDNWLQAILQHEAAWQHYFAEWGVTPFTVVYENFTTAYEATVFDILCYLHIPAPDGLVFGKRELQKQANALSEEWVQRYHDIKEGNVTRPNCQGEEG
jgi:LPS sulfotransferase NodH